MRIIIIALLIILFSAALKLVPPNLSPTSNKSPTPTPTPKTYPLIDHYNPPVLKKADSYTIIFVGDSMTDVLGPNFDDLRRDLKDSYPQTVFGLFNYGFGSTNILSVQERLEKDTVYNGNTYPAILGRYFDIIIIESLGHNPLSQYSRQEGLQKQSAALDQIVAAIVATHPNSLIIFLATIAPSKTLYAKGVANLTLPQRKIWAEERLAYIENHILYAKNHNLSLIDVYHQSLDKNGNAILKYINHDNYIHPSAAGLKLISNTIADYLKQNNILP